MGILDSILGLGSSAPVDQGAMFAGSTLDATNASNARVLRKTTGQANDALSTNMQSGLSSLDSGYQSALQALTNAGQTAQSQLAGGVGNATSTVLGGNTAYQPAATAGGAASNMLANAEGLNGAAGSAAARAAFQTSPGYEFQQQQAADQTARQMGALGLAGSGTALNAILNGSSNLANTEYQNYLTNLSGTAQQGLAAASGISANNQTAGGYQYGGGSTGAQLAQNLGQNLGTAYTGQGTGEANLYSNLGQGLSSNLTGLGAGIASTNLQTGLAQAGLEMQQGQADATAQNTDNSILSKLIGGVTGLPLGGSSLSSPSFGGLTLSGSNGGLTISPAAASSSGGGIFGSLLSSAGTGLSNAAKGFFG